MEADVSKTGTAVAAPQDICAAPENGVLGDGVDTSGDADEAMLAVQRAADFATLDDGLKLKMVSAYLRAAYFYCLWCGIQVCSNLFKTWPV